MPKKENDAPEKLRPYIAHGLELNWGENSANVIGTCPMCDKEGKFGVKIETGLYNFHSWALLAVVIFAIVTGFGRQSDDRPG